MTYDEWTDYCRRLDRMTIPELRAFAKEHEIRVRRALKTDLRNEIVDALWGRVGAKYGRD